MIGIDSNVLLRALLTDDAHQAEQARHLLKQQSTPAGPAFINRIVLCETLRTLARGYRYTRDQLGAAIERLLAAPSLLIEGDDAVEEALEIFRANRADFADALIGVLNRRAGCAMTYTFDHQAAETPDFTAVG